MRFALVRRMVHVPVAECPAGREVARWEMRVAPAGTAPVVTQVVATQCTLPLMATVAAAVGVAVASSVGAAVASAVGVATGVTAPDGSDPGPVPASLVAVAANV